MSVYDSRAKIPSITLNSTNDDRFWAVALAVYAAEQAPPPPLRPIARAK